jgi:REP element-mobilizing transposase RayT
MARRPRVEYDGAIHHVTGRGVKKRDIYLSPSDRLYWLNLVAEALGEHGGSCLAYCQMNNHYHMVLRSRDGTLSRIMQWINGRYGTYFNRQHDLTGHVLQGRFHAQLVDRESYLGELIRYVLLNPVRAGLVNAPSEWDWSSCQATLDLVAAPAWLDVRSVRRLYGITDGSPTLRLERLLLAAVPGTRQGAAQSTASGSDPYSYSRQ